MLPENVLPSDPTPRITRWNCAVRGAWIFGLTFFLVVTSQFLAHFLIHGSDSGNYGNRYDVSITTYLITLYIATPPLAFIGGYIGYDLYRLASGARQPNETKWYVWALAFCCLGYWLLAIYLQYRRRDQLIMQRKPPSLIGPTLYGAIIVGFSMLWMDSARSSRFVEILMLTPVTLCLADCLIVNQIAAWHQAEILEPADSYKFQFSLGTLFFSVVGFGAYASGLVVILR